MAEEGREELGQQLPKLCLRRFLMRRNWGWVGAGKDQGYKLGCAWTRGKELGKIKQRN